MKTNKKNGFTLVELLAVIVILAIILVIAVPKVMSVIEDSKKATLEATAKMIAGSAEKVKVQNTILGKTEELTCDSVAKLNDIDYASCEVEFVDNTAKVTIKGSGKFDGLWVCAGDKTTATATTEECGASSVSTFEPGLYDANDVMLASWYELVNDYGYDVESDYEANAYMWSTTMFYNFSQNESLSTGTKLVVGPVSRIGNHAFQFTSHITTIVLPDNLTEIGDAAFSSCGALTSINIPSSVSSIGSAAFSECDDLDNITIPASVTSIGMYAFQHCFSLSRVNFENTSGWYVTTTEGASSGTNVDVTDAAVNAINLTSSRSASYDEPELGDHYWYRGN